MQNRCSCLDQIEKLINGSGALRLFPAGGSPCNQTARRNVMRKTLYLLVLVLALSLAYAISQTGSSSPGQTSSQSQPSTNTPTTPPDQSQTRGSQTAATAGGDVQSQIQNALKNDPSLSSDNIT